MKNRLSHQNILLLILFISILFFYSYPSRLFAGSALLSWNAPSTNEDGTPTGNYTYIVDVGNVTTYTFTNLTDGLTYYFIATAYNLARFESSYSNEVSKTALSISSGDSASPVTSYSFTNVNGNHTISVSFTQNNDTTNSVTNIPKTGQTLIYASGDDGNIQAGVEWSAQRFTDNGDGTVTDSLTGLMWLKDGGCMKAKWESALGAVAGLNNHQGQNNCAGYNGNYSDWRLPNIKEVGSLINYGTLNSAQWLNSEGFVNMKPSYYWSSTTYHGNPSYALKVRIYNGMESRAGKSKKHYILPVRGIVPENPVAEVPETGQKMNYAEGDDGFLRAGIEWPTPRFTDNGDGTVTDSLTGLMWLKDGGCLKKRWSDTLNIIVDFNANPLRYSCLGYTANYNDWRMPNVKELESMINYETSDAAGWLNSAGFTNVKYSSYWSSTTSQKSAAQAWMMNMKKSGKLLQNKKYNYYAWPVRGGNIDAN